MKCKHIFHPFCIYFTINRSRSEAKNTPPYGLKNWSFWRKKCYVCSYLEQRFFTKIMEKWSIGNYEDGEKAKITSSLGWLLNMPRV